MCSCNNVGMHHVVVFCSSSNDEMNSTCNVEPPRLWCEMYPDSLLDVLSVETVCHTTAVALVNNTVHPVRSSSWLLRNAGTLIGH